MRLSLCVVGDNVDLGAQLVDVEATSASELTSALSRAVRFSPADYNKIVAITRFSQEHNVWVGVSHDISALAAAQSLKVHVICEKNTDAVNDALFLEVLMESVVATLGGGSGEAAAMALQEAKALFRATGGGPRGIAELNTNGTLLNRAQQKFLAALQQQPPASSGVASVRYQAADYNAPVLSTETSRNKSAAPASRIKAGDGDDTTTTSARRRAAAPSSPDDVGATATTATTSTVASQPQYYSTASSVVDAGDTLTVFCVYTGTTSQRAKAFRISRSQPSIEALLHPLRQKFSADLVLGFIAQDGSCNELLRDSELASLIAQLPPQATCLTLHCWTPSEVAFDDQQQSSYVNASGYGGAASSADQSEVSATSTARKSARGGMKSSNPAHGGGRGGGGALVTTTVNTSARQGNKSSRPSSVTSMRSYKSAGTPGRRTKHTVDPDSAMDASGVAWTNAQLEQMFDKVDVDGSGSLSRQEFFNYMTETYDDMGVPGFKRKIAQLIDSAPEFVDGELGFNEFCVIMLKIAQW